MPQPAAARLGPLQRRVLLLAVFSLALATCASSLIATEARVATEEGQSGRVQTVTVAVPADEAPALVPVLPDVATGAPPALPPAPDEPVATAQPTVDLPAVEAQLPQLAVSAPEGRTDVVEEVLGVEGVTYATAISRGEVEVEAPAGARALRLAAVEPVEFRVLTPQVTADAVAVWQRILEGDAAFIHDIGNQLELELGADVQAGANGGAAPLRVGAFASNGVPPVADAIVSRETAERLGLDGEDTILVAVDPERSPAEVARLLEEATGLQAELLDEPAPQQAFLVGADAEDQFEPFTYIDHGDGLITIDPDWVARNIVTAEVPIFRGAVRCHRLLIPQLRGALQEVADAGLADLIDPSQYGGCWVARHIDWSPSKPLSMHAWGLAVDFNVSTNQLGATPTMDPRIVAIFDRWGFVWGGRWSRPDGMHFELGAVLQSPEG